MLCSPGVSALQRQLCFAAPETVLCSQGLCSAAPGKDKGEEFVLWGTRLCFVAQEGWGEQGGCALQRQARGVCALEHQVLLCSTSGDGGEQGGCALQRQGRGEERGLCFGAPG